MLQVLVILTDYETTMTESDKKDAEKHAHDLSKSCVKLVAVLIGPLPHPQQMDKIVQNTEMIKSSGLESSKVLGSKILGSMIVWLIHLCERK